LIPEGGGTTAGGRVRGRRGGHPSPFKDDPLPGVLVIVRVDRHNALVLLKGVSMGEALAVASGTATIEAEGIEAPAPLSAPWQRARASANLALFSSLSTIPAQNKHKSYARCNQTKNIRATMQDI